MRFNPALVSSFLFASAFLVGHQCHCEQCKSWLINRVEQFNGVRPEFDIFASSTLKADNVCHQSHEWYFVVSHPVFSGQGNYDSISATFHAPSFFALDHSFAGVGVAMGDLACETLLMAAVSFGYYEEYGQLWSGKKTLN